MEQEEYTKEQIDWSYIDFVDNQDVLDMIEKVLKSLIIKHYVPNVSPCFILNFKLHMICIKCYFVLPLQKPQGVIALLDEAWYDHLMLI